MLVEPADNFGHDTSRVPPVCLDNQIATLTIQGIALRHQLGQNPFGIVILQQRSVPVSRRALQLLIHRGLQIDYEAP